MTEARDPLVISGDRVTFTEHPDILITAECAGLTMSWLKGSDDDAATEKQKALVAAQIVEAVRQRESGSSVEDRGNGGV